MFSVKEEVESPWECKWIGGFEAGYLHSRCVCVCVWGKENRI